MLGLFCLSNFSQKYDDARLEPLVLLPARGQVHGGELAVPVPGPVQRHGHRLPGPRPARAVRHPGEGAGGRGLDGGRVVPGLAQPHSVEAGALQLQTANLEEER